MNKATGETAYKLLFGIDQRGKIEDKIKEFLKEQMHDSSRNLPVLREKAKTKIEKSQEYSKNVYNKKHIEARKYEINDLVMIKNFDVTPGISHKLIPKFKGPYRIIKTLKSDRYVVGDIEGFQAFQKPYQACGRQRTYDCGKA